MQSGIQRCSILIFMDPRRPRRLKWSVGEGGGMRWEIAMRVVFNRVFVDVKPRTPEWLLASGQGRTMAAGRWGETHPTAIISIFVSAKEEWGNDSTKRQWRKHKCCHCNEPVFLPQLLLNCPWSLVCNYSPKLETILCVPLLLTFL